jgi:hypothetical protein
MTATVTGLFTTESTEGNGESTENGSDVGHPLGAKASYPSSVPSLCISVPSVVIR